jgi:hypothetical protein
MAGELLAVSTVAPESATITDLLEALRRCSSPLAKAVSTGTLTLLFPDGNTVDSYDYILGGGGRRDAISHLLRMTELLSDHIDFKVEIPVTESLEKAQQVDSHEAQQPPIEHQIAPPTPLLSHKQMKAEVLRNLKPKLPSAEKLGNVQLADSLVTQESLFELDTQPLLAPPPPKLSYRQKKSEEWFTRCHRAGPEYEEHFPLPKVRP